MGMTFLQVVSCFSILAFCVFPKRGGNIGIRERRATSFGRRSLRRASSPFCVVCVFRRCLCRCVLIALRVLGKFCVAFCRGKSARYASCSFWTPCVVLCTTHWRPEMVPRFVSLFLVLGFLCVVVCSASVGGIVEEKKEEGAKVETGSGGSSNTSSRTDNQKLEHDELSTCLRVSEAGNALDRWLHCLDVLERGWDSSRLDDSSSSSSLESESQPSGEVVRMDSEIVGAGGLFDPLAGTGGKVSSSSLGFEDREGERSDLGLGDELSEEQVLVTEAREEEFVPEGRRDFKHQISSSEGVEEANIEEAGLPTFISGDSEPGAKELDVEEVPDSCEASQELQSEVLKPELRDERTDTYKKVEAEAEEQEQGVARTEDELKGKSGSYGFENREFQTSPHNEECEGLRNPQECSEFVRAAASVETSVDTIKEKEMAMDVCTDMLQEDPVVEKTANVLKALKVAACIGIVGTLIWRNKNRLGIKSAPPPPPPEQTVPSVTGLAASGYSSSSVDPVGRFDVKAGNLPAPLGNAIATVMAEVLEHERAGQDRLFAADELAKLLEAAMVESLSPIMGSECSSFVDQFKQAFQSTYRLIGTVKVASAKRLVHSGPQGKQSTRSHKCLQDGFPSRTVLGRVAEGVINGNLEPKYAQDSESTTSDAGIETDDCDLQSDLAEQFERMTFSSDNPKVEVGSAFTQRKTETGHYGESLCTGSNGAPAGSSAHQQAEIESKITTGIFSNGSGPHQTGQEGFGELGDMPSSSSRPPNVNGRTFRKKWNEGHDIHETLTQGSHRLEGFRSRVREMDRHVLDTGLFEGASSRSGSEQPWHEQPASPMETRELDREANQIPPSQFPSGMGQDMVLSTLSLDGSAGNLQQEFLHWYKKSLAEKQQSNYLKTLKLAYQFKRLNLDEEHLHLRSESNLLMRENVSLSREKAEFREMEIQDRKLAVAYDLLSRTCADELVAGLFVMLCALLYGGWNYSYARLVDVISHCQPAVFEPSHSMIPGFNRIFDSLNSMSAQMQMLFCNLTVAARMFLGLGIISMVAATLLRKSVTSSSQAMPASILLIILGGLCGAAGKFAVDSMGGSGYHWLLVWESLCVIHASSTCFTPYLYWLLNGAPQHTLDKQRQYYLLNPWVRRLLFHGCLGLVLPAMAGLLPFAPFREVLRTIFSTCLTIVYTPVEAFVTDKFKYVMPLN